MNYMVHNTVSMKSMDHSEVIACLLSDVYTTLGTLVAPRYIRLERRKISRRLQREGSGFLTKSLPRLGKALDRALLGDVPLDCTGFRKEPGTKLPRLFGKVFQRVFSSDGWLLPAPCVESIRALRQLTLVYYKYELPYDRTLEQEVIRTFTDTEQDVVEDVRFLRDQYGDFSAANSIPGSAVNPLYPERLRQLRRARKLVHDLFAGFDIQGITPRHGPGVVSSKEKYDSKYRFDRINPRAQQFFPFDEFNFINMEDFCANLDALSRAREVEFPARVTLVPKDSRGPRVISCEPLENQWLQQGLMRSMVAWIETHPLTRKNVRFTDQEPNRMAALAGSYHGTLATLDLKEASDRVSIWLVEQLFPEPLLGALLATRSLSTVLPDGKELPLHKFAPMGSACCFPVLAICVWAILASECTDDGKPLHKDFLVFGDDVIVDTAQAVHAINSLESYGLHVNKNKSCTTGLFRESCGMDAYDGVDVTPVRFRTVWCESPTAGAYESWIAYANQLYHRGYTMTAMYIAEKMAAIYGTIPEHEDALKQGYPCFSFYTGLNPTIRTKVSQEYQRLLSKVRIVVPSKRRAHSQSERVSLFRYFTERCFNERTPTTDIVLASLTRIVQTNDWYREIVAMAYGLDSIDEKGCTLDDNWYHESDNQVTLSRINYLCQEFREDLVSRVSEDTGLPQPVVDRCLQSLNRRPLWKNDVFHVVQPSPLDVYAVQHTSKLKWAWR